MKPTIVTSPVGAELFHVALEAAPIGMMLVGADGRIAIVNTQLELLFGYGKGELVGAPVEQLVPARFRAGHPAFRAAFASAPTTRPMGVGRDLHGLRRDGTEVPIEIGLNPLTTSAGSFVLSSVVDISERKRAEADRERLLDELRGALRERELMLQEIHHRVKNNLQIITSVINLQLDRIDDAHSRTALVDCRSRVHAMSLIHEQLYESSDYARVRLAPYVGELARNVVRAAEASAGRIALALELDDVQVPVDQAIPCGLIVTELLTNALKHGFPDGRPGTLRVALRADCARSVELVVGDNGVGMPATPTPRTDSLGLQLVHALTSQLGGRVQIDAGPGTTFHVSFPREPDLAARPR